MVLLVIMTNMIIAFQRLNYSMEYLGGAIVLAVLLVVRMLLASKSKGARPAKRTADAKTE